MPPAYLGELIVRPVGPWTPGYACPGCYCSIVKLFWLCWCMLLLVLDLLTLSCCILILLRKSSDVAFRALFCGLPTPVSSETLPGFFECLVEATVY